MRVIFSDTMRYGLINNPWRNWGPVGQRVPIPKQMEFEWGYLWAEIDVISGELNVWLLPEMNSEVLLEVVTKMPQKWGQKTAIKTQAKPASLVWDNSKVHKAVDEKLPNGMKSLFLPPYSPELNPVERFFEELRRKTANRIFDSLEELEKELVEAIQEYVIDRQKVRQLCGYPWIIEQLQKENNIELNF